MSNHKKLTMREQAVVRFCWIITKEERAKLDKFFLVQDSWRNASEDILFNHADFKSYLRHEDQDYEVVLCSPVHILEAAEELGMSFRVNYVANLKVVLIKEWKAAIVEQNGKGE